MKKWIVWLAASVSLANSVFAAESRDTERIQATALVAGEHIAIDGRLDDAAWRRAAPYPVAHTFSPTGESAAIPETVYRVMVDREFLYVGIDCRDPNPKAIWQMLAHRDVVANADTVKVWIDPQGTRKFAQIFKVAAGGAIRDGTYYEDSSQEDTSPDFAFESATHIDERGWSVELKIPASSLRFSGHGQPTILVSRAYPRGKGFIFASTAIDDRHQCILCKNPTLGGLDGMQRGGAFTLTPYASITKNNGDFGDSTQGRAGADLKWRLNDSAVIDATVYPDFSQVELDTPQLSANASYALFYPEKRPFFLEGLDLFDTPMRSIYTRTITKPNWGARITNRGNGNDAVLLATHDDGGGSVLVPGPFGTDLAEQPASTTALARSRFHVHDVHAGVFAAMKDYGDFGSNAIGGGDAVYSTKSNRYNAQMMVSHTTALTGAPASGGFVKGDAQDSDAEYLGWKHDSSQWHARSFLQRVGNNFRDDSGFVEANGLYSSEAFVGRDIKPILGASEVLPYLLLRHKETLDGQTISTEYMPGVAVDAGSSTHFELLAMPASQIRTDSLKPLHRLSLAELIVSASPARWMPETMMIVDVGHRLDTLSDRVGSGYSIQFTPTFLIRSRLRIGGALAQEYIGAEIADANAGQSSITRTLLRDTVVAINASYFFDSINELRATYQHHETSRDPLAFTQTVSEHVDSDLVSLVYTWTPSLGKAFYAGGTWSSAKDSTHTEGADLFIKMSWAF